MFQAWLPSHLWLRCEQSKRFVCRRQETVANFSARPFREIQSLMIEV
jgi:hypothetical protein